MSCSRSCATTTGTLWKCPNLPFSDCRRIQLTNEIKLVVTLTGHLIGYRRRRTLLTNILWRLVIEHRPLAEQNATRPLPLRTPVLDPLLQARAGDTVNPAVRHHIELR
jgi:hypothetical protein